MIEPLSSLIRLSIISSLRRRRGTKANQNIMLMFVINRWGTGLPDSRTSLSGSDKLTSTPLLKLPTDLDQTCTYEAHVEREREIQTDRQLSLVATQYLITSPDLATCYPHTPVDSLSSPSIRHPLALLLARHPSHNSTPSSTSDILVRPLATR